MQTRTERGSSDRCLDALMGLRFLAAMRVVPYHGLNATDMPWLLVPLVEHGPYAVALFFMLSGFVLAYVYGSTSFESWAAIRSFAVGRFARVYPLYLAVQLLALPIFLVAFVFTTSPSNAAIGTLAVLSLIHAWSPRTAEIWNAPTWSLSAEVFFYCVFPFLMPLIRKRTITLGILAVAGLSFIPIVAVTGPQLAPSIDAHDWSMILAYSPLLRLPEFLLGACLGQFVVTGRLRPGSRVGDALSAAGVAGFIGSAFLSAPSDRLVMIAGLASLIVGLTGCGWVTRACAWRPLVFLGQTSYALYLIHVPLIVYVGIVIERDADIYLKPFNFVLCMALVVVLAILAHLYIERPTRNAIRRRWGKQPVPRLEPATMRNVSHL